MKTYSVKTWPDAYKILWDAGVATGDNDGEYGPEYDDYEEQQSPEYQWRRNFEAGDDLEIKTPFGYIMITKETK